MRIHSLLTVLLEETFPPFRVLQLAVTTSQTTTLAVLTAPTWITCRKGYHPISCSQATMDTRRLLTLAAGLHREGVTVSARLAHTVLVGEISTYNASPLPPKNESHHAALDNPAAGRPHGNGVGHLDRELEHPHLKKRIPMAKSRTSRRSTPTSLRTLQLSRVT